MNYDNSRVVEIVALVGSFLRERLPTTPNELKQALTGLEMLRMQLLEVRVDWQMLLAEKKSQMLYPKDKEMTELDRRTRLNASVANIERDTEFLLGLEKIIDDRLKFGQSLI